MSKEHVVAACRHHLQPAVQFGALTTPLALFSLLGTTSESSREVPAEHKCLFLGQQCLDLRHNFRCVWLRGLFA